VRVHSCSAASIAVSAGVSSRPSLSCTGSNATVRGSRKAAETDADVIVFCGVRFMGEVAKILSPEKTVLIPDMNAGCSLETSCPPDEFKAFREAHPEHIALTYINCSAEVKALSDIIVTSSNAEFIVNQIPHDQPIIFAPDQHLGRWLIDRTGRDMLLWKGSCMVHEIFSEKELVRLKTRHPKAHVIAHPECPQNLLLHSDFVGSTSKLLAFAGEHDGEELIVMTEPGILHQMKKNAPNATFYDVPGLSTSEGACASCNECPYMKLNTMEKLYMAMVNRSPELTLDETLRLKAKASLDKMLEMSPPKRVN
jgi:quinolinate synthase